MGPQTVSPTAQAWEAAVAAERAAHVAMDRYHRLIVQPLNRAYEAGTATRADVSQAEDRWGPYLTDHLRAVDDVIATPAPDLAAVIRKLEVGLSTAVFGYEGQHELRIITDDIRRLAGR